MNFEDFKSGGGDDDDSGKDTSVSRTTESIDYKWTTKIDFGSPYILVARDVDGEVYCHRDEHGFQVWEDREDWRRIRKDDDELPDDISEKLEVVYTVSNRRRWLQFCNRATNQHGEDPEDYFDNKPEQLAELRERTHFPNPSPPDKSRTCQICGTSSDSNKAAVIEVDLFSNRRVPLCEGHTVKEMAQHGLLD